MKKTIGFFLASVMGGFLAIASYVHFQDAPSPKTIVQTEYVPSAHYANNLAFSGSSLDFTVAAKKTVDAVVHVKTEVEVQPGYNPWMDFFGYDNQPQIQYASGSGVIIGKDGYIVTNNHVIEGAEKIMVSLNDNRNYTAHVIGTDPATDIALIKVDDAENLPVISLGNSDNVEVGEWVLAVGNPFDLTSTVTAGIVSAKARNINLLRPDINKDIFPIESFIQTDAAVNPGNSGGALVNVNGELIGINTAIASRTGSFSGYSFAVPMSIVEKVTKDLMEFGSVQRAFIGVRINNVDDQIAEEVGLKSIAGVYVNGVVENGAASKGGIDSGDIILKVAGKPVKNVPELQEQVNRYRPGDEVEITIWRDGKEKILPLKLRNKDGGTELNEKETALNYTVLGAELVALTDAQKEALDINYGVKIVALNDGKLRRSGVKKDFIITQIDGEKVQKPEDINRILGNKKGGVLIEGIYPNGTKAYYGFGL